MKRKQPWMIIGGRVLAIGRPGKITSMQENTIDGIEYVYYIHVKVDGQKPSGTYHPNDIAELKESEVTDGL